MNEKHDKNAYDRARRRALQRLSRLYRDEYLRLVELELGRPIDRTKDQRRMASDGARP